MENNIIIRDARIADAPRLLDIYSYYVENTAVSFEVETPTLDEFKRRMIDTMKFYPYLTAERDGEIIGYACAHSFIKRAAYDRCCELTIYLDRERKGLGAGRMLYEKLEKILKAMGILNMYVCIGVVSPADEYLNNGSADFHARLGFKENGYFTKCGYKFGRWYDMIWMEKLIGQHIESPVPLVPYSTVKLIRTAEDMLGAVEKAKADAAQMYEKASRITGGFEAEEESAYNELIRLKANGADEELIKAAEEKYRAAKEECDKAAHNSLRRYEATSYFDPLRDRVKRHIDELRGGEKLTDVIEDIEKMKRVINILNEYDAEVFGELSETYERYAAAAEKAQISRDDN